MTDTQPYRPRPRGWETLRDMAWSLIPVTLVVLGLVAFCQPTDQQAVRTVDPRDDIRSAAEFAPFPVLAPTGLPSGWRPTSSGLLRAAGDQDDDTQKPVGLTIGYVTPRTEFARFTIRQGEPATVLRSAVDGASVTQASSGPAVQIGGRSWTPFTTSDGKGYRTVSGSNEKAVSIVVVGTASDTELRALATSVQTVKA